MNDSAEAASSVFDRVASSMRDLFDEGTPAVLRSPGEVFTAPEVFEWIKLAHPPHRANTAGDKIVAVKESWGLAAGRDPDPTRGVPGRSAEVYANGAALLGPSPFLPSGGHATFEEWIADVRERLGGDFGMQAPGLECATWDALGKLQALLAPILAITGPRSYRFNAFAGDYRRTPFGFHVDPHQEAVFQVALIGNRRGKFWEGLTLSDDDASWVEDSNGLHAPSREPESTVDVEPGDIVFWPGTHVHGFECDGPSLALSIVVDRASPRSRAEVVSGLETATMRGVAALPGINPTVTLGDDDAFESRSAFGLAYESHDDALIVGVCGRTFEWPDRTSAPSAVLLLDYLRTRPATTVGAIIQECSDDQLSPDDIRSVLSMMAGMGYTPLPS